MSWSYDTEAGEVSDDAATLAQPTVSIHMARGYIPYSIEVGMDYPGFATEMGRLLDQGYSDLLAAKTMTGRDGHRVYALPHDEVRALLKQHGMLAK